MKGFIYKVINSKNDKVYIGQTSRTVRDRWEQHSFPSSKGSLLKNAILEIGLEFFSITQLAIVSANTKEELSDKLCTAEKKYIKENNSVYPHGYNVLMGGKHAKHSSESKEKIAASKRGKPRPDMLKHMDKIHEKCKKPIKCNETGQVWESVKDCAKSFDVKPKQICRVLKGQRKRLKWQFTFSYLPQS
jgi:group I intron endonuclease